MATKQQTDKAAKIRAMFKHPPAHIPAVNMTPMEDVPAAPKTSAKLVSDKPVILDREKSIEYLDLPIFPGERQINDSNVQFLMDHMLAGTFLGDSVTLCTCWFDGIRYKINGQHTCWALNYAIDKKPSLKYKVRELEYEAKSMEQLKQLYASFDRGMSRTESHLTKVYLIGTDVAEGMPRDLLGHMAQAMRFWLYEKKLDRERIGPQEISAIIQQTHAELFRKVIEFYQRHQGEKFMKRQPVLAAICETFNKLPSKAQDFWAPVVTGVGIEVQQDPRLMLRNHLQNVTLHSTSRGSSKKVEDAETQYRTCLQMWKHWRQDKLVQVVRVPRSDKRPKAV